MIAAEAFLSDHQSRDNVADVELALNTDGKFLALRVLNTVNLGAYLAGTGIHCAVNNLGGVNAAAKMHRLAGAKIHQSCWQEGPRTGGLFVWHQAWVGLSTGVSELARRAK